ncbi:DUF4350 domain-containing protein [Lentibacillus sediminis]|uniref:DUF4350 domain-containing protein n=1 Tax=Lentibacillus sediminis TaxID=1940529 RepID=UPI000C1BD83D|nr:DUF4350 domain-containing protein [Lentibacillus sediminis]
MNTSKTGRRALPGLIAVLLLFIGISYIAAPEKLEEYPAFVSESPAPAGVKAFYTYLDRELAAVERWTQTPELLPEDDGGRTLVMVGPSFVPDSRGMMSYVSFMEAGNTILLLKTNPADMFGIETMSVQQPSSSVTDQNGNTYQADVQSMFRIDSQNEENVLLSDQAGVIAVEKDYGSGRLITAVTPEWLTNENILKNDHLELAFSLLPADQNALYFDEYVHGSGNAPALTTVYPQWMLVLALQAILLAIIWLWYHGKRFGPVVEPREASVRFSDERIQALAAWYLRGRRYRDALAIQVDYVKLLLQERWGIPYYKEWPEIADQLKRKTTLEGDMGQFLYDLSHVLNQENISKKTWKTWSKKIDKLREEVEEG